MITRNKIACNPSKGFSCKQVWFHAMHLRVISPKGTLKIKLRLCAMHSRALPLKGFLQQKQVASIRNALACNPYKGKFQQKNCVYTQRTHVQFSSKENYQTQIALIHNTLRCNPSKGNNQIQCYQRKLKLFSQLSYVAYTSIRTTAKPCFASTIWTVFSSNND